MLSPKELKEIYNRNFSEPEDKWSVVNIQLTDRIARRVLRFMTKNGYHLKPGAKSLDVGCAKGHHTESFRKCGFDSYGLDYSDVAVTIAREEFPMCNFYIMDGFNPDLTMNYDLIFMKGFSGTNTHDFNFVNGLCEKYLRHLMPDGWFVLAYSSNFSGRESTNETANWSMKEIMALSQVLTDLELVGIKYFNQSRFVRFIRRFIILGEKEYFYLMYKKKHIFEKH